MKCSCSHVAGVRRASVTGDRRLDHAVRGVRQHQRAHDHDRGEGRGHDQGRLGLPRPRLRPPLQGAPQRRRARVAVAGQDQQREHVRGAAAVAAATQLPDKVPKMTCVCILSIVPSCDPTSSALEPV